MMWFLGLYKCSVKRTKMRTISVVALIGIVYCLINLVSGGCVFIGNYHEVLQELHKVLYDFTLISFPMISILFVSGAFCAIGKYFHGNMKIYAILVGVGFIIRGIFSFIYIPQEISISLSILCYLLLALFFFGFSKTNKK